MPHQRFNERELELIVNQDGLCPKPPFKSQSDECRYYARFIEKMLWRYFTQKDWKRLSSIIADVRVDPKLKRTTEFLIRRHAK